MLAGLYYNRDGHAIAANRVLWVFAPNIASINATNVANKNLGKFSNFHSTFIVKKQQFAISNS